MSLLGRAANALVSAFRQDDYVNTLTGLGGDGSRNRSTTFEQGDYLQETELNALFDFNWLARRIVTAFPDMALRKPLVCDQKGLENFNRLNTQHRSGNALRHGCTMGLLHGGAAIVLGAVGSGAALTSPLPVDPKTGQIKGGGDIAFLDVLTKWELKAETKYPDNFENPLKRGAAETFKVQGEGPLKGLIIHETRLLKCEGLAKAKPSKQEIDFPWISVLQPVDEVLKAFGIGWSAAAHLLQEASIGVMTMPGLEALLTTQDKSLVDARMDLISVGRSVAKTLFLQQGETFQRESVSFASVPELLQEFALLVCGAARIPATELFGRAPAGMNATGESDTRQLYDTTEEYQRISVKPKLDILLTITKSTTEYSFAPLWEPSAAEKAKIRQTELQGDNLLWSMGVIEPWHVLKSRAEDGTLGIRLEPAELNARLAAMQAGAGPKIVLNPESNAKAITVNEIRENQGKDALALPGGGEDPDGYLPLFAYELKKTKQIEAEFATEEPDPNDPNAAPGEKPAGPSAKKEA